MWLSVCVWWRLLLSVGISCSLEMSVGCLGDVWWVFGGVTGIFMEIGGIQMCLGLSGFSVPAVWSRNTILSQPWNKRIVCTWDILDIKIPKPPNIRFPKIIGFVQFLIFLVPSEKYYKSQSLLITLYHTVAMKHVNVQNCPFIHGIVGFFSSIKTGRLRYFLM